jgi:hypothetical protein
MIYIYDEVIIVAFQVQHSSTDSQVGYFEMQVGCDLLFIMSIFLKVGENNV